MFFKHWPTWPDRTGTSTLTATTVDPYDDAQRIVNYTSSYIDPDANPSGHASATIGNNVTQSGNAGIIYPHSLNPLRKFGEQIKFKGVGFRCRRLNNRNVGEGSFRESIDGTVNYYDRAVSDAPTLGGSAPLDVNLYNAGYTHHVRVGWNLVITYRHFYGGATNDYASWSALTTAFNNAANRDGVYFVGEDGKFRLQTLELDEAFCEYLDPTWGTGSNDPDMADVEWKQDLVALRFVGTPPSVDECPIAQIVSHDEHARDFAPSLTGDDVVRERDLLAAGRRNWVDHQLAGYAAGQNALTYQFTPGQTKVASPVPQPESWPHCLIFDGDSGTPHFASTHAGEALLGFTNLITDYTDQGMFKVGFNMDGFSREFFDDYVAFSATTPGAHALDSDGSTGLKFVDPVGSPNTIPSITGPIKPKRTEGAGKVPSASNLEQGEIATNLTDGKIFSKKADGTVVVLGNTPILEADVPNLPAERITSGTLDNARLSNIPVSKLTGTLQDSQVAESSVTQHADAVAGEIDLTELNNVTAALLSDNMFIAYNTASTEWTGRSPSQARTALGLGTSATVDTGTSANQIVKLDGSAKLPAVDGSQLTGISAGGGNDYLAKPTYTDNQVRLFDDFYQCTPDRIDAGANQWWLMSGGSGVQPADYQATDIRGAARITIGAQNNRRYTFWGGMFLTGADPADGDELVWETRVQLTDNSSTTGALRVGVIDWTTALNFNDATPVGDVYTGFDFASIAISCAETNLIIGDKDTGGNGNGTKTDLGSSYPKSSYVDTFVRLACHAKYNNTDSDWDLAFYVNGVSVHTLSMTFSSALVPYIGMGHSTQTGSHSMEIDWISYQVKQGSPPSGRTTLLDIESI